MPGCAVDQSSGSWPRSARRKPGEVRARARHVRVAVRAAGVAARRAGTRARAAWPSREAIDSHDAAVLRRRATRGELVGLCTAYQDLHSVRFGYRAAGSRTSPSVPSAARRGSARRCSTRPRTGPASAAPPTSSSTAARPAPTPTASTSARSRSWRSSASPGSSSGRARGRSHFGSESALAPDAACRARRRWRPRSDAGRRCSPRARPQPSVTMISR